MVQVSGSFSGFSVDDIPAAEKFYGEQLGLAVTRNEMGILQIELPGGGHAIAYPKPNHEAATFTVLNLVVDDVDRAVDELNDAGVVTKIYSDPASGTDDRGIMRGHGPTIAWFTDPAGNVLSVIEA